MSLRLLALPATAILTLAACTLSACTTPTPTPTPTPPTASCNAEGAQVYVGKVATPAVIDAARRAAGAEQARTLKPGQMVTMEFIEGRLNVHVDAANVILRAVCG
ncbi:MAG: I78 family peptidase inhibitor [Pseudomonadota bacterium]|nr:I78 family peptidase inhibitor [Pseudomonadota bacterium]MDQ3160676.1 I78 family peptidase inhibitor [Pseudomonadota bacterium]